MIWDMFARLIGLVVFIAILYKLDFSLVIEHLNSLQFICLIMIMSLLMLTIIIIKARRWQYLLFKQNIRYSFGKCFYIYGIGLFAASFTPIKLGDFIKVLYLREDGYLPPISFYSVILDNIYEVCFALLLAVFGMVYFCRIFIEPLGILCAMVLLLSGIVILVKYKRNNLINTIKLFLGIFISSKYRESIGNNIKEFVCYINSVSFVEQIWVAWLTVLSWTIYFTAMYLAAIFLGIKIPVLAMISCVSIAKIVSALPISIMGLGTRDITLIYLFFLLGIDKAFAVAYSFMFLFGYLIIAIVGIISWLYKPLIIKGASIGE